MNFRALFETTLRNRGWEVNEADQSGDLLVGRDGNRTMITDLSGLPVGEDKTAFADAFVARVAAAEGVAGGPPLWMTR